MQKNLTNFIWYFVKKQKGYFIALQCFALAWALDNTGWPYAIKLFIDKIIAFTGNKTEIWYYLMPVLFLWAGLWIFIEVSFRLMGFTMARVFPRLEADVRMSMFDYVTGHSFDFFANHFSGNISNRVSDITQSLTRVLQLIMTLFIPAFLALLIAGTIFFTVNYLFALLLVGWAILHIGICFFAAKKCSALSESHSNSRSFLTGKIVDAFTNIINVKVFAKKRYEYDYIGKYQEEERKRHRATYIFIEKIKIALGISAFIFPEVLITWLIIHSWQQGSISVGDMVLIINTTWNIQLLAWIAGLELPNLFKEIGVCQQALRIIQMEHDIKDKPDAKQLTVQKGAIKFDAVTFNYLKGGYVFEKLSVDIEPGSKVGLVGFSGSGKTTFVNLIMRFFDIESGKISIDGTDICDVTTDSLRSQISMIPQDPSLFHRTLRENICYGKTNATELEMIEASKYANCHDFITAMDEGYEALVGERGVKLSGGQRQRVAIARAILENAPILILDEATSALDSVTEKRIQDALHYLMEGKTTVVIAHRLSTLAKMDRIIVFNKGCIVEDGTHESLLNHKGHYAKMWHMQAGGFLPDALEGE